MVLGLLRPAALAGNRGLGGFVSPFIGMMVISDLDYDEILTAPYLAVNHPEVIHDHGAGDAMGPVAIFFPLAGFLSMLGYTALAFGWMKSGVLPPPICVAMIIAALAFGFGLILLGGLMSARITAVAFGAALIAIGVSANRSAFSLSGGRLRQTRGLRPTGGLKVPI